MGVGKSHALAGELVDVRRFDLAVLRIHFHEMTGMRHELAAPPRIVDLSALWAGPLCAHLLQLAGASVVKLESTRRPDGARFGAPIRRPASVQRAEAR